ncbi:nucleoside-diphosphate-sugar epimerase [Owenweeksia hongkongensis DSM 17368]|uniref:Nucleoside-diphosphate-sugar epimerase n=1 Tax=Owenweeksia hongkongensis (strain DSM 17368 / CIP 108786 / JCM 12287 / NRRL B-23963 / UST20020801) TaxID=926562 RepID=G8R7P3_OWEHD|nr:NAD(P)-dependent oxidoreductase [Owenweeksia hongkongensis]AEV32396.1 nucleoside-diphosphate-sugar epimerase [Owenweeksia hongkongensis DSM 17368]
MTNRILVTGGAGYIGSVLVRILLEQGHQVRVIDNLMYGGESIIDLLEHPNFEFVKGDIRNREDVELAVQDVYAVAHLAAIVGDPACAKSPELTNETNLVGAKMLYEVANAAGVQRFIFASTCSNYGKMDDPSQFVTEESTLAPVSLYAETKVAFEKFLLGQDQANSAKPTCLRFSTVYGLSPRVRFDLTVNEFTKEVALDRELVIFGEQFWRPYCHVRDLARSVKMCIEVPAEKVSFNVFNVGNTEENYQKQMIVEEILKVIPEGKVKYVEKNEDPRDYRVNFDKIKKELGFEITLTVPQGIENLYKAIKEGFVSNPDEQKYKNI